MNQVVGDGEEEDQRSAEISDSEWARSKSLLKSVLLIVVTRSRSLSSKVRDLGRKEENNNMNTSPTTVD